MGWFERRTWKNDSKWYTQHPKLVCNFYSIKIIYKIGRGPGSVVGIANAYGVDGPGI